jgi:cobalt-zinc-cadmium efflux system membrane fusion protein
MTSVIFRAFIVLAGTLGGSAVLAQSASFALADDEIARLGITLARPQAVQEMEIASAPAEVVVPPAQQALISTPVDGLIARILVAEGDAVSRGQALAELEGADFLDWQRGYLDAVVESELADAQQSRDQGLYEEGIIAERRLQETQARTRAANVRLDQARRQLLLAGFNEAALERLAQGGELVGRLVLRAPLTGVVLEGYTTVGARVAALDPVMRIADLHTLWLELHLRQELATQVAPGMRVSVTVGDRVLTSTVTIVGSFVDAETQAVLVRAVIEDPATPLRAGQYLTASIVAPLDAGVALALPATAVTRNAGESYVFVRKEGAMEALSVNLLADDGSRVYVLADGLDSNARVAVEGISVLKSLWLASEEEGS